MAYQRQTMLQKVDDIFSLYNRVRVAAGVPIVPTDKDDPVDLPQAEPEKIIQAFMQQQGELQRVEVQLAGLGERLEYLQDAEDELTEQLQPEARNIWDEHGFDRIEMQAASERLIVAKRTLEAVDAE
jgi:hypothetical protein